MFCNSIRARLMIVHCRLAYVINITEVWQKLGPNYIKNTGVEIILETTSLIEF